MSDTQTMIKALRILAQDIHSEDGVANACIADAADMIERLERLCNRCVEPLPKCPITRRDLFMIIDGNATYGGPFDSYTIPYMEGDPNEQWHERELVVERFDHDAGTWADDETIPLRIVSEEHLFDLEEQIEKANERVKELEKGNKSCAVAIREIIAKGEIGPLLVTGPELDEIVNKFAIEQKIDALDDLLEEIQCSVVIPKRYEQLQEPYLEGVKHCIQFIECQSEQLRKEQE